MKSDIDLLKERWTLQLSKAGIQFLFGKGVSPFPRLSNGLEDLRGILLTEVIKCVTIRDVDMSGASVDGFGQFGMRTVVERCSFCKATLDSNVGEAFHECDLSSVKMSGGVLRGEFVDCDFTSANLTSVVGTEVKFIRCVFAKTNFRKAHLIHCYFEDCRFENCKFGTGSFGGSKFVRSPIDPETLGNTLMENVKWL